MSKKMFILILILLLFPLSSFGGNRDLIPHAITSGNNVQTDWVSLGAVAEGTKVIAFGFSGATVNFRIKIQIKVTTGTRPEVDKSVDTADFTIACSSGTCTKTDTNSGDSITVSNPFALVTSNRIEELRFSYWANNGSWDYAVLQIR